MKKTKPFRPTHEQIMQISAINSLLNLSSYPILCFYLKRKEEEKMMMMKTKFLEFFFSGALHSLAQIFDPELCEAVELCNTFFLLLWPNTIQYILKFILY